MLTTALPPAAPIPRPTPVHANANSNSNSNSNTAASGAAGFASLLNQAEQGAVRDDAKPAAPAAQAANNSHPGQAATTRSARPGPATPATGGGKAATAATRQREDAAQEGPPGATQNGEETASGNAAADASALLASLAAWAPPTLPKPLAATGDGGAATQRGPAHGGGAALLLAGKTGRSSAADGGAETSSTANAGTRTQGFAGLVALAQAAAHDTEASGAGGHEAIPPDRPTPLADAGGAGAGAVPLASALIASAASGIASTGPAAEARLSARPGSAEFASQLGAQLTTFVRAGVQHARLELHPTELGPVTVQIQLDGGAAQVNLAALNADTRQALEQALPQLASSLREAGLTLSGGGVFEQPRQAQPDASEGGKPRGDAGLRNSANGETAPFASHSTAPQRRRGVVDLVA